MTSSVGHCQNGGCFQNKSDRILSNLRQKRESLNKISGFRFGGTRNSIARGVKEDPMEITVDPFGEIPFTIQCPPLLD